MATPKFNIKSRATTKYRKYKAVFGGSLDAFTDEVLKGFCETCAQIDVLNEKIAREGLVIETDKGPKENPAINTKHKLETDKARAATLLRRVLNDAGGSDDDPMGEWFE